LVVTLVFVRSLRELLFYTLGILVAVLIGGGIALADD
jgi:hypothetical protein